MRGLSKNRGISKTVLTAIIVIVVVVVIVGAVMATYHPSTVTTPTTTSPTPVTTTSTTTPVTTSTTTSTTTPVTSVTVVSNKTITIAPPNSSELIDISLTFSPDALDPATGFYTVDTSTFNSVYQGLVTWNPNNYFQVEPSLATNWTISPNYKTYTFTLRKGVYFSDGEAFNATVVWFSLYRTIVMGQGVGISNYLRLLFSAKQFIATGYTIPWGACNALSNVTGNTAYLNNASLCANALANVLSNFNVHNSTIQKLMSYPNQGVVVLGPYTVQINLLHPYRLFLLDLAAWWGSVVPPGYVDAHGGVQPMTTNSYTDQYGLPGTGPYEIYKVVGTPGEFTEIILKANPNYWGNNYPNGTLPVLDQPAHIPIIEEEIALSHTDRVSLFDSNDAQISTVSPQFFGQMYDGYEYSKYLAPQDIISFFGYMPAGVLYISMNNARWPTNITDFRLAVVHAINSTALLYTYYSPLLHKLLAEEYLGPSNPQYAPLGFYDPDNLPNYTYSPNLAIEYLNKSGWQGDFYTVLPNGTEIGNPNGQRLPTIPITVIPPVTPLAEEQLTIISQDLNQIGIPTTISYATTAETDQWTAPSTTARMVSLGWVPDWPDPIYQLMYSILNVANGGISGNMAWFNNSVVNNLTATAPFITNAQEQEQMVAEIYNITYNEAPYYWLPWPEYYLFTQPYLKGITWTWDDYFYNTMYYQPVTINIITYSNGTQVTKVLN